MLQKIEANSTSTLARTLPVGAEITDDGVHFRVWAPECQSVEVIFENGNYSMPLTREKGGYFAGKSSEARPGDLYRYCLDGKGPLLPDPASRFQPEGPEGPSQIVDPHSFIWTDQPWKGPTQRGNIIYEMHVGTFTQEGTWEAATHKLPYLVELGITMVELMPVADFAGSFGWGYDGVDFFAPTRLYGTPDDFRSFVNKAHESKIAIIIDVVYNHAGIKGNYLTSFSPYYMSKQHTSEWGRSFNFDEDQSGPVREFFTANAAYWVREFHVDGLRVDATQQVFDNSDQHIIAALSQAVRDQATQMGRELFLIGENEPQHGSVMTPVGQGGCGLDALWNDDFHHSASVVLSSHNEAYYSEYFGTPQEFVSLAKYGYLYQGQFYRWQGKARGLPARGIEPFKFINYIQNHDQIANTAHGRRCHELTSPGRFRAMTALLLLSPQTPLIFQGQEFGASSPFHFFLDIHGEPGPLVREGRIKFLSQFRTMATAEMRSYHPNPSDSKLFRTCKLDHHEHERNHEILSLYKDLIALRNQIPAFAMQRDGRVDGAVLGSEAFVLRYWADPDRDHLLIVNFGRDRYLPTLAEPLLAPELGTEWSIIWHSESPRYGGGGSAPLEDQGSWRIPGHAALVLGPQSNNGEDR